MMTLDTIGITDKKLLQFKLSKSCQILHVDKTGFPRPDHICKSLSDLLIIELSLPIDHVQPKVWLMKNIQKI